MRLDKASLSAFASFGTANNLKLGKSEFRVSLAR
jgi:hypothetical protein